MRYAEMKNSGVEWIGDIPCDWKVVKSKYCISISHGCDPVMDGNIPVYGSGAGSFKTCGEYKDGPTVLLGRKGATLHIPHYVTGRYWNADTAFDVKNKRNYSLRFYYYLAICFDYKYYISQTTLPGMTQTNYLNMKLPVPPLAEQEAIVAYLDKKCAAIDDIIGQAKATIKEYKAWKASVIFEAVTKGLDPNAEMKNSGIPWIGKIPKNWNVIQLKRLCEKITDGSHFSPDTTDDGLPYVTAADVDGKGLDYQRAHKIRKEDFEKLELAGCRPFAGDVLLVKDGATTGRVGLMTDNEPCVILSSVAILRPSDMVSSLYLMYLLKSEVLQFQIRRSMAGSAMPRATLSKLNKYITVACPPEEQDAIVTYLDKQCAVIDGIIAEKQALIDDLETYKKSLIYETVTGKRSVC